MSFFKSKIRSKFCPSHFYIQKFVSECRKLGNLHYLHHVHEEWWHISAPCHLYYNFVENISQITWLCLGLWATQGLPVRWNKWYVQWCRTLEYQITANWYFSHGKQLQSSPILGYSPTMVGNFKVQRQMKQYQLTSRDTSDGS